MSTDFESRLAELLNESVDAQLGRQIAGPPFTPPTDTEASDELAARRRRRFTFLAVAATIVAIATAALTLNAVANGDGHPVTPATRIPLPPTQHDSTQPVPQPSTRPTAHPSTRTATHPATRPTSASSTRSSTRSPAQPATHPSSVRLGQASIALPQGWVARQFPKKENVTPGPSTWCLSPRGVPVSVSDDPVTCPVEFGVLEKGLQIDPDFQGGGVGDAEYCDMGRTLVSDVASGDIRGFGGRDAFYYTRNVQCDGIGSVHFAQYEVAGSPAFVLYAQHATSAVRADMQLIASNSQLPAQTSRLWRVDLGRVTSMTGSGSHVHITLNRIYLAGSGKHPATTIDGQTARYTVTTKQLNIGSVYGPIKVKSAVMITTNGSTVTGISNLYG